MSTGKRQGAVVSLARGEHRYVRRRCCPRAVSLTDVRPHRQRPRRRRIWTKPAGTKKKKKKKKNTVMPLRSERSVAILAQGASGLDSQFLALCIRFWQALSGR
mmetsp:Transcript_11198/g.8744  ORF Transcript_11198/g.8744 Transcript_11198/m.8744 type:complete len:103 (+) Transcript_11198:132-440(+)